MQTNLFTLISKTMKKFLIKVAFFFFILAVVDYMTGALFSYMSKHTTGGQAGRSKYITDETYEDILIFGSSRAIHHYNPEIISDSMSMTCYNCGSDGQGIILFYGWWQMIKERYHPKIIIYDIHNGFDLLQKEDNHKYLGFLKGNYERLNIRYIFESIDKNEKYKMLSQIYRYNSRFHYIISDYMKSASAAKANGYMPLIGEVDTMRIKKSDSNNERLVYDPLKIEYLEKLIDEADGVKLIFAVSPIWYGLDEEQLSLIRNICKEHKIPFLDFSNDPKYVHNNEYFKDGTHLNAHGADEFSRDLISRLKTIEINEAK